MQSLPGFRDFYPEDCSRRRYFLETWRRVCRGYGFVEYDAPTLENVELYEKKNSGGEIMQQLYAFQDRGERRVALRPEMTPSLVRMVAAREKHYRKPLKWFSIGNFFRFERQQKGRLREFIQLNCDLIGEPDISADAELLALTIDILRAFGLDHNDFFVRVSSRTAWMKFFEQHSKGSSAVVEFLSVIDKLEREPSEVLEEKLKPFGISLSDVRAFVASGGGTSFDPLLADLEARGLRRYVEIDLSIVRGLAYYTGLVFEVFDRAKTLRAVAGGGRYDHLIASLSDGGCDLPATGFAVGDVVLMHLINSVPKAREQMETYLARQRACEIFVVVADDGKHALALELVQRLRSNGRAVDFCLKSTKVGKQFQAAEQAGANWAVVVGHEWPKIKVKNLAMRTEAEIDQTMLLDWKW